MPPGMLGGPDRFPRSCAWSRSSPPVPALAAGAAADRRLWLGAESNVILAHGPRGLAGHDAAAARATALPARARFCAGRAHRGRHEKRGSIAVCATCCPMPIAPLIVAVTIGIPVAIFAEAGLSFLGLGINDPIPSWGQDGSAHAMSYMRVYWHLGVFPTLAIAITMLGFTFVGGRGLRDAFRRGVRTLNRGLYSSVNPTPRLHRPVQRGLHVDVRLAQFAGSCRCFPAAVRRAPARLRCAPVSASSAWDARLGVGNGFWLRFALVGAPLLRWRRSRRAWRRAPARLDLLAPAPAARLARRQQFGVRAGEDLHAGRRAVFPHLGCQPVDQIAVVRDQQDRAVEAAPAPPAKPPARGCRGGCSVSSQQQQVWPPPAPARPAPAARARRRSGRAPACTRPRRGRGYCAR
jgi:hypothetical protein